MKEYFIAVGLLLVVNSIIPFMMSQMNIKVNSYLTYLLWLNALLLFFLLLPNTMGEAFL